MKKIIFLFLVFNLSACAVSANAEKATTTPVTTEPKTSQTTATPPSTNSLPAENAPSLPESTFRDLEAFAAKKLNEKKDLEEVKKTLKVLLALEDEDPSRTGVMILSESYNKYKSMYDKVFKTLETKENKEQIKEIKMILANHYKKGNG